MRLLFPCMPMRLFCLAGFWMLCLPIWGQELALWSQRSGRLEAAWQPGQSFCFQTREGITGRATFEGLAGGCVLLSKSCETGRGRPLLYSDRIPIGNIRRVYDERPSAWRNFRHRFAGGSIVLGSFLIGGTVLHSLATERQPSPYPLLAAVGVMGFGKLVLRLGRDQYALGPRWRLEAR